MRNLWKVSKETIRGRRCIELRTWYNGHENVEYTLAGRKGEIYEGRGGTLTALVTHSPSGYLLPDELLVRFGDDELERWVERLQIPEDPKEQTPHANCFGKVKRRGA